MMRLEAWGGAECSVNRVDGGFTDQLLATGLGGGARELDLVASLGLAALRVPVLWERVSPDRPDRRDFTWSDRRIERLGELGIRPIIGLIHHGSGPFYTSLLDESFAAGLAAHAQATAERYPWAREWTPVNEPVTTARFSALYGHWYPHLRDERSFWVALLNQVDAISLSMRAIRAVNPAAQLIQTDDLGRTYATAGLTDQAAFDNTRRWLGWDLLCGHVVPGHPLWNRLCGYGLEPRLRTLADDPCPPSVIGINHYLTSDRFIDHRVQRYPRDTHGHNGEVSYADVAAVRVLEPPPAGLAQAINDAWDRYRLPIALTEVHNGCTREEQLRWLDEAWQVARQAQIDGVDIRAVTAWALFGNQGWNTLLTGEGRYEAGAFDMRGAEPRPTAIARVVAGSGEAERHPVQTGTGWWRRPIRVHYPAAARAAPWREHARVKRGAPSSAQPLLITGATGTLGRAIAAACAHRDIRFVLTNRSELDLHDPESQAAALNRVNPWAVVNAAGWVRVDDAEDHLEACLAVNRDGAVSLARACAERGVPSLSFSSDLVFPGRAAGSYCERDATEPRGVYGRSKAEMERAIADMPGDHLVVRTAAFFSPYDDHNFAMLLVRELVQGRRFAAACDHAISPTYVPHLCDAALDLLIDGEMGIWHLSNAEQLTWAQFACRIAKAAELDEKLIDAVPASVLGWRAARPSACGLVSGRGDQLPTLDAALREFATRLDRRATEPVSHHFA